MNRIYLIGMMGVGKSTIARLTAQQLNWIWVDTDVCVERNSCLTVAEVFDFYGEEEFRRREWGCVRQTTKFRDIIVACGGGAPCFYTAMDLMLESGIVIYLSAKIESLIARLQLQNQTRPLLVGSDISMEERLRLLLTEREPVYQRAHYTLQTDDFSEIELTATILDLVSQNARLNELSSGR